MAALSAASERLSWLAVLETRADGSCEAVSAPIAGPSGLEAVDTDAFASSPPLVDMLAWMEETSTAQLWAHPSYVQALELHDGERLAAWIAAARAGGWQVAGDDALSYGWLQCYRSGVYGKRAIYLPSLDERQVGRLWGEAADGRTLLEAVLRYNGATGHFYTRSPAHTGRSLLRALHAGHPHWLEGAAPAIPPARDNTERRYDWCRPLLERERGADVLVSYDKNAMYLGACAALECGYDEPEHLEAPSILDDRLSLPGYFRVEWEHHISPLPPIVTGSRLPDGTIWVSQPTLTLALAEREVFSVVEAYVWPRHHRILQPWYVRLREARAQLRQEPGHAAGIAAAAVKLTYSQTIAQFDGYWLRDGAGAAGLYRPHWRHAVVAQARTNVYRALAKMHRETGLAPFAVVEDACYFLLTHAQDANLRAVLPVNDTLGGFKLQDRVAAPTAIVAAIEAAPLGGELRAFTRALAMVEA